MTQKEILQTLPQCWLDCSPAQLAYLVLYGSYGQKLIATRYLETIAKGNSVTPQAFPKGRWTV